MGAQRERRESSSSAGNTETGQKTLDRIATLFHRQPEEQGVRKLRRRAWKQTSLRCCAGRAQPFVSAGPAGGFMQEQFQRDRFLLRRATRSLVQIPSGAGQVVPCRKRLSPELAKCDCMGAHSV
jgi:hypothetical protein